MEPDDFDATNSNDDWLPDRAFQNMDAERSLHPEETPEQTAQRLFKENASLAVQSILHIAVHGTERARLEASKYVVERVLGRVGDDLNTGDDGPIATFVNDVVQYAEAQMGKEEA
jgi:hypothetical protein